MHIAGCSAVRLARVVRDDEVGGSNPLTPTCKLSVVFFLSQELEAPAGTSSFRGVAYSFHKLPVASQTSSCFASFQLLRKLEVAFRRNWKLPQGLPASGELIFLFASFQLLRKLEVALRRDFQLPGRCLFLSQASSCFASFQLLRMLRKLPVASHASQAGSCSSQAGSCFSQGPPASGENVLILQNQCRIP